ncbi:hypothetical protein M2322_003524 [Rhodoblastus acidophilus]|uniref:hypothetical protein n=1 Tax=Rhodoblastus acidophilus TaxID=1074 RepID=UPI002224739A|nr:hypothetical protein [Rhodoblastus acidophilus]MCW2317959.1 hypothetical protein [Rhodoblastus acidophilus]
MTTDTLSREDLKELIKEAMREEFELIGIDATNPAARVEIRKDMETLRNLRTRWDRAAAQVGNFVLWLIFAGALALLGFGAKAKLLGG